MSIKRITISNFKSFDRAIIEFNQFNIIIGANAAGKSNVIRILQFLYDVVKYNLDDAIAIQGGIDYFVNSNIGHTSNFKLGITQVSQDVNWLFELKKKERFLFTVNENTYEFELQFNKKLSKYKVVEDKMNIKGTFYRKERKGKGETIGDGELSIINNHGKLEYKWTVIPTLLTGIKDDDIFETYVAKDLSKRYRLGTKTIMLEHPLFRYLNLRMANLLNSTSIYDFDPKLAKKAQPISGLSKLQEDGSNLATIINNLLKNRSRTKELHNILLDVLPAIDKIQTKPIANSMIFQIQEKYTPKQYFPSFLISDGTINLTALIVALFFETDELAIIEEPERNIHPYLISKLVSMMRDASKNKQIITTTHNPEVVRHADPMEIILVSRTDDGFSKVIKPIEQDEIKVFLENDMGLEELYVQNLLTA